MEESKNDQNLWGGEERRRAPRLKDPELIADLFERGAASGGSGDVHGMGEDPFEALFSLTGEKEEPDVILKTGNLGEEGAGATPQAVMLKFATEEHVVTSRLSFKSEQNGAMRMSFPEEVTVAPQQRGSPRVKVNAGDDLNLLVDAPSGVQLGADPSDISQGGLAFSISGDAEDLSEGDEVSIHLVRLGEPDIEVRGVVVNQTEEGEGEGQCLRVQFQNPEANEQIEEIIEKLTRERRSEWDDLFGG